MAQDCAGEAGTPATAAAVAGPLKEAAPMLEVDAERKALDRKRKMSDSDSPCSSSPNKEAYADDKDDDDDEDMDDDDKSPPAPDVDPERLKAFNMFVRLFVDENLDRMVPISKQPKDKIQAILDACDRQFPEYHDRSRKRVRTYLKSCRRMRRAKEMNGWDSFRPTPPHLTSAVAESILAQACDNESQNAKRMRMGLEPLAANAVPTAGAANVAGAACLPPTPQPPFQPQQLAKALPGALAPQPPTSAVAAAAAAARLFTDWRYPHPAQAFRPDLPHFFGNGLFRPPFLPPYASHVPQSMQHPQLPPTQLQNGPADLSVKKSASSSGKSPLNPTEIATIRQLIAGYRESAAFLYRSADELEQLLMQQN